MHMCHRTEMTHLRYSLEMPPIPRRNGSTTHGVGRNQGPIYVGDEGSRFRTHYTVCSLDVLQNIRPRSGHCDAALRESTNLPEELGKKDGPQQY